MVFYEPGKTYHGLPRDPFKSCVTPRPIGWISTRSLSGIDNLAPYSQFTNLTFDPPTILFSANTSLTPSYQKKDSALNAEETGEFVWNVATWNLREHVNATAETSAREVDEFVRCGVEKGFARVLAGTDGDDGKGGKIKGVPVVKESPIRFECKFHSSMRIPGNGPMGSCDLVVGRVVAIYIDDSVLTDGMVDLDKVRPIARCGYHQYSVVSKENMFEMVIPGDPKQLIGLEGNAQQNQALASGMKRDDKDNEMKQVDDKEVKGTGHSSSFGYTINP